MSQMKKILIVDDSSVNRKVLCKILSNDHEAIEAENGKIALELLKQYKDDLSLILLDLVMPVMDGYEFLDIVQADTELSTIPIIVTTSSDSIADEIRCLSSGASDFVAKPYNPEIVKHRVASIIRLRETAAVLNLLKYDQLTGVYSKEFFYQYVARTLAINPDHQFDIICSDVENFKLVNERFGVEKGDELLCYIAEKYKEKLGENSVCGRIGADVFAILVEHWQGYSAEDFLREIEQEYREAPVQNMVIKWGIYEVSDRSIPVSGMCDRAILAVKRIKHQYNQIISRYDDTLRLALLKEQQILDNMEQALSEKQFQVYLQPKYDVQNNKVVGAEALVRWKNPEAGFIFPNDFIPLFEQNGFITKLDYYVWEEVCRLLQAWGKAGHPLVPISVNVSRVDFNLLVLAQEIVALVDRYELPHELLHLEVTESAYTDNPKQIITTVEELRCLGFKIEMDDFGSGYSSINMLSELPIDVLKLDMRFIQQESKAMDKKSILSFVISLSKWLDLDTVAEGVETKEQVDLLRNMGCDYVQGYYYAKPMPAEEFEQYLVAENLSHGKESKISILWNEQDDKKEKETILVIGDEASSQQKLSDLLEPYYHVIVTNDGREAYRYLHEHGDLVSMILLNQQLPIMESFQLLHLSRMQNGLPHLPVIMTSSTDVKDELHALQLGADCFLEQPCQKEILLHHVRKVIDSAELARVKMKQA